MSNKVGLQRRVRRSEKSERQALRVKQLLAHARRYRETHRERIWKRNEEQYRGAHWPGETAIDDTHDLVTVNMSFSTINTLVPYIAGTDPSFIVEPYGGDATVRNARLLQAMLNRLWRSSGVSGREHLQRAAWDYVVYGDGFLKISHSVSLEPEPGSTLAVGEVARIHVDRISPWDIWIDPSSDGVHNARWVINRIQMSVEELQEDPRYQYTAGLNTSFEEEEPERETRDFLETGSDRDRIISIYEFYDIPARELIVVTDQRDVPIRFVEGIDCPIVHIPNHVIPNSPYHMGELEQLWTLQQELNKTRTQMVEHRRRNAQKWLARRGALSPAARDALESEDVNAVVEVDGNQVLQDIVIPLQVPALIGDAYGVDGVIKQDIFEISGVNEYLRGSPQEIRRTATEATIIEGASNAKTAHKLGVIERAAREVGQWMLDIAQQVFPTTSSKEMTLILTGREAQAITSIENAYVSEAEQVPPTEVMQVALEPKEEMFEGTYEVFVEQGSTELRNPVMREQKYRQMYETLVGTAQVLAQAGVPINWRKMLEMWFDAAGIDDIDSMFDPAQASTLSMAQPESVPAGSEPAPGAPNLGAAMPPLEAIAEGNSGILS